MFWLLCFLDYHPPSQYIYSTDYVSRGNISWGVEVDMPREGSAVIYIEDPYAVFAIPGAPDVTISIGLMPPDSTGYSSTDWYTWTGGGIISIGPHRAIVEVHSLRSYKCSYLCFYLGLESVPFIYRRVVPVESGLLRVSYLDPNDHVGYLVTVPEATAALNVFDAPPGDPPSVVCYTIHQSDDAPDKWTGDHRLAFWLLLLADVIVSKPVNAKIELRVSGSWFRDEFGTVTYEDALKQDGPLVYTKSAQKSLSVMTSPPQRTDPEPKPGVDKSVIIGGVLGGLAGLAYVGGMSACFYWVFCHMRRQNEGNGGDSGGAAGVNGGDYGGAAGVNGGDYGGAAGVNGGDYGGAACGYDGGGGGYDGGGGGCDFGGDFGGATAD